MAKGNIFLFLFNELTKADAMLAKGTLQGVEEFKLKRKLRLLQEVIGYIRNGDWTNNEVAKEKLFSVATKGYEGAMIIHNSSRVSLTQMAGRNITTFLDRIGSNFIEDVESGQIEKAASIFQIKVGYKGAELFPSDLKDLLPPPRDELSASLKDSAPELMFLHSLTTADIKRRLNALDADRLALLLYITEVDDIKYSGVQNLLLKFLTSRKCKPHEFIREVEDLTYNKK